MLNIPEPIKELFKRDNVLKNIRVTFPNGERADICNDQIVKESVNFTESLATGDPVVFGLCEASSISFECVDVENINGMSIFVYIEIDISSLTAAQQIAWGHSSADVPFMYYPVPLGLFIVDECKRRCDINQRSVIAYSPFLMERDKMSSFQNMMPYDQKKASGANWGTSKTMSVDWRHLAVLAGQRIFDYNDLVPLALDSRVAKTLSPRGVKMYDIWGDGFDGNDKHFRITVTWTKYFTIDLNAWDYSYDTWTVIDCKSLPWTAEHIWWWGSHDPLTVRDFNTAKENIRATLKSSIKVVSPTPIAPNIDSYVNTVLDKSCYSGAIFHAWKINASSNPTAPTSSSDNGTWYIPLNSYFALNGEPGTTFPMEIEVKFSSIDGQTETVVSTDTFDLTDNNTVDLYQVNPRASAFWADNYIINYGLGLYGYSYTTDKINNRYSFLKVWREMPFDNMLENILEVNGYFGGLGRDGKFRIYDITSAIRLVPSYEIYPSSNIYPSSSENTAQMFREDYIDVWYDEYVVYYGSIYVEYKDSNGDDAEYTEYLLDDEEKAAKLPVYDLSNNALFQKIVEWLSVEDAISCIKDAINALAYYRSEISMRALPYMEIGDMLFIKAKDDTFATPIMTQTITGIQDLRNVITSD